MESISPLKSLHEFLFCKRKHLSSFNMQLKNKEKKKEKLGAEGKIV